MNDALTESTLGEIFEISSSKRVLRKQWRKEGVPFYRAREIVKLARDGKVDNELFISEDLFRELTERFGSPQPGDLMVSAVGTLGACYVVQPGDRFYFKDASVIRLSPKQPVCPEYFRHAFRTKLILDQINSGSGSTVGTFTISRAKKTKVPLPSLKEQKRIAAILDAADALRAKRREALAQLDTLLQSTFLEMFGDPVSNPKGWRMLSLRETRSKVQIGPFGSLLHKEDYVAGGIPLVNPMHIVGGEVQVGNDQTITPEKAESLSTYLLRAGDVVMGRRGEMGRCAIVSTAAPQMLCGTGSLYFRPDPDELIPDFLAQLLSSSPMRRHLESLSQGVTMPNLNRTMVEELRVVVPPIETQRHFATIVQSIEQQKSRLRAHLNELDTLFASLQARAFAGEL